MYTPTGSKKSFDTEKGFYISKYFYLLFLFHSAIIADSTQSDIPRKINLPHKKHFTTSNAYIPVYEGPRVCTGVGTPLSTL